MQTWLIQVQFDDKTITECPLPKFKRKLKGTGIEVDVTYKPVYVAPGRFIGRGRLTRRAARKLTYKHGVHLFSELRLEDAKQGQ